MRILCTQALEHVFHDILPHLPHGSVLFGTTGALVGKLESGEEADLILVARPALEELARRGKVDPASLSDVASTGVGVSVKAGTAKPDISDRAAFAETMRSGAVAYPDPAAGGASGVHFAQVLERLGIAAAVNERAVKVKAGGMCGDYLLTGEATLAVQMISELLPVAGTELIGPFPADLQKMIAFSAAVVSGSAQSREALEVIAALKAPAAAPIMQAAGLEQAI